MSKKKSWTQVSSSAWLGVIDLPCGLLKSVKEAVQNLTWLWGAWRLGSVNSFKFLKYSGFVFIPQLVVSYGVVLAPSVVNAVPLWSSEESVNSRYCISEIRLGSQVPSVEIPPVNRTPLNRNEYEKGIFGVATFVEGGLDAGHKEPNDRTENNKGDLFHPAFWILYGFVITYVMCRLTPNDQAEARRKEKP